MGKSQREGLPCVNCKYLRKALQTKKCKRRPAKTTRNTARRLRASNRKARRLVSKVKALSNTIANMKRATAATAEKILQEKLQCLPLKQQLAVKQCFEAAKRKSTRGMAYDKEWVLECILLEMRSPKLYDYIRRQSILVLPGRSTIRKYMSNYKGSFGFNDQMLRTLKKKTCAMKPFKCHGGLVIDEMKLSEHLSVDTAGKVAGFVDLGPYTPQEEERLLSDHGLVVMFVPLVGSWT